MLALIGCGICCLRGKYAPRRKTPVSKVLLSYYHLLMMGSITMCDQLYTLISQRALNSGGRVRFLKHLRSTTGSKSLIIWDVFLIHRKGFLLLWLVARPMTFSLSHYRPIPLLNPTEGVWHHFKHVALRNVSCKVLEHLHRRLNLAILRLRGKLHLIQSFFEGTGLLINSKLLMRRSIILSRRMLFMKIRLNGAPCLVFQLAVLIFLCIEITCPQPAPNNISIVNPQRVEVKRTFVDGMAARDAEDQRETAITRLEATLKGWQDLKEESMAALTVQRVKQLKEPPAQAASGERDERPLLIGETVERPLKGGELHFYTIELKQGQVLQVNVQEKGVDLRVGLRRLTDEQITTSSDFGFGYERETLTIVIRQAGNYEVLVGAREQLLSGTYQMTATLKETTDSDNERVRAERLLTEGLAGRNKGTTEGLAEAIEKWGDSLGLWKKLGEKYWEGYTSNLLGIVCSTLGDQPLALKFHNQALTLLRAAGDKRGEAAALNNIGAVYDALDDEQQALKFYNDALPLYRQVGDKSAEAYALSNIGAVYFDLGDNQTALKFFNDALSLLRQVGDQSAEATTLTGIGAVYSALGNPEQALNFYNEALPLRRLVRDNSGEATTLNNIGAVHDTLGNKQLALKFFDEALSLARKIGNKRGEAQTLTNIGKVHIDLSDKQQALKFLNEALPLRRLVKDRRGEAQTLTNIGTVYSIWGDTPLALKFFNDALPLSRAVKDRRGEATTLMGIGGVYSALGEKPQALKFFNDALSLYHQVKDKSGEAQALTNIGKVWSDLGDKQQALKFYNEAIPLRRQVKDKSGEGTTLNNIGAVYAALGEKQLALKFFDKALELYRQVAYRFGEANTLNNTGGVFSDKGDKQQALKFYNEALLLRRQIGDKSGEVQTLTNIGAVYSDLGKNQQALKFFDEALPLHRAAGDKRSEAVTLNNIGAVHDTLGDKSKALNFYNDALLLSRAAEDKSGEAVTLNNLMFIWASLNNRSLAIFYGKQSVNKFQQLRGLAQGREVDSETQKSFLRSFQDAYKRLAELLIFEGQLNQAVQVLSLYQDQQFFDFNRDTNFSIRQVDFSSRQQGFADRYETTSDRVGQIGSQIGELKRKFAAHQPNEQESAQLKNLEVELKNAAAAFLKVLRDVELELSKKPDERDKVLINDDVDNILKLLDEINNSKQSAVTIYTLIGEKQFHLLLVSKDGIKHFSTTVKGRELNKKAKEFAENINVLDSLTGRPKIDVTDQAKELYIIIFKSIENELPKDTATIMWNLDGNLRYVPINALHDGKDYLVRRNLNNVVVTRFDIERITRSLNPIWNATGFATTEEKKQVLNLKIPYDFPPLFAGEYEMKSIFKTGTSNHGILEGDILLNAQFRRENMFTELKKQKPVVHISSHFKIQPGDLTRSFLVLGDGTAFSLFDMREEAKNSFPEGKLFAGVDLLTLSACDTGISEPDSDGREVDSFAELAQRFGAASVMATLWSVNECSTAEFMRLFYKNKIDDKMNKAEAIRQAQLALLDGKVKSIAGCPKKSEGDTDKNKPRRPTSTKSLKAYKENPAKPFEHPYYWSPFILYGNWK